MNPAPKVICLGEALVDRLGPLGGDPATAPLEQCDDRLGGAPANVACALARLGTPSAFVGRLGQDAIGESFERLMAGRGVELAGLQRDASRPSRVVLVRRHADGERVFQGFAGDQGQGFSDQALDCSELRAVWLALAAQAQWLLVGTIPLATAASAESLRWAVDQAKGTGVRIALDVNLRPTFWDEQRHPAAGPDAAALSAMQPLVAAASLLKLAKEEALWLFGSADPSTISAGLPQAPDVLVTDGGTPCDGIWPVRPGCLKHWHRPRWWTPRERAMPLVPVCCTSSCRVRCPQRRCCVLPPPAGLWSVVALGRLIPNPMRLRCSDFCSASALAGPAFQHRDRQDPVGPSALPSTSRQKA